MSKWILYRTNQGEGSPLGVCYADSYSEAIQILDPEPTTYIVEVRGNNTWVWRG